MLEYLWLVAVFFIAVGVLLLVRARALRRLTLHYLGDQLPPEAVHLHRVANYHGLLGGIMVIAGSFLFAVSGPDRILIGTIAICVYFFSLTWRWWRPAIKTH